MFAKLNKSTHLEEKYKKALSCAERILPKRLCTISEVKTKLSSREKRVKGRNKFLT